MTIAQTPAGKSIFYHLNELRSNTIPYIESLAAQGDFVRIPFGPASVYFINHPDDVREVLVTQAAKFNKPFMVKFVANQMFGFNLFSSDGDTWKVLRKAIQPAFHTQRINSYAQIMIDYTERMLATWQAGQTVDIPPAMMDLTMSISTKALFGVELRDAEAGQAILQFLDAFNEQITATVPAPGWVPLPTHKRMKQAIKVIDALLMPMIAERQQSGVDHGDLLSMLLIAQREDTSGILSDHQVRNEIVNLFAAGYEVNAHTTAFTLYLIAQHPEVEARLFAELDNVIGDRRITVDDIGRLPYLNRVIKESMRLLPVATVIGRNAVESATVNGTVIAKGQTVLLAPWTLHRRPDIYPEPERFDPERFSPEREGSIPKHAYIPFSSGPRICIGNGFAMLQLQITLATMLQRFRVSVPPGYTFEPIYRFNTRPNGGLPITLHSRD